ncbi:MAG: alpha/beta fold hydrolase [Deltaproteobacteria bacterium]|nr:alpha/beta fold hydrolase [Deltaproteobacteria bacterium]
MNRFAYRTAGLAVKTLTDLSKAEISIHGEEKIPEGAIIFVINHFTRIETLFIPYYIHQLVKVPVWSLADYGLFKGALGGFLDNVGAVSTKNPDRDLLIVKSLLTGEAAWIIFPEGRMVKSKKIIEKGRFMVPFPGGSHRPHTGAATLALRTEFYRERLRKMMDKSPDEAERLMDLFQIGSIEPVLENTTYIVPVNVSYFPMRARENILSELAKKLVENLSDRMVEEIMMEGTMLLSGVDVDIRFGEPIEISHFVKSSAIEADIISEKEINFDDPIPSKKVMRKSALDIMKRYMSAIYEMTTVNHDHLFASMLKHKPVRWIDPYGLKLRVFLTATHHLKNSGANLHKLLTVDQVHLLTDDRFNKFRDFMSVALEKGVVRKESGRLVKDPAKFSSVADFHHVRVDNPIAVMANEVEPLTLLQRRIKRIAWQPAFWLKRKVVSYLLDKAVADFETDYKAHYIEGESKKKEVGMPFLIKGRSRKLGVLLIHGYMAAPLEVKALAQYLSQRGLWVYVPRLKGHGTSPDDLAKRTYLEWITSVDEGYAVMRNLCKNVVVGGFSTGAGLALDLATRVGDDIRGVFAVSPPLRLQHLSSKVVPAVDVWNRLMEKFHMDGAKMEFVENKPENPHINYFRNPISGVREIERLMESLEPRLPDLKIPALVAQSHKDPVVDPRGSKRIFELLGSKDKKYILFNFDRHGILLGEGADRVHKTIWDFIDHLAYGT